MTKVKAVLLLLSLLIFQYNAIDEKNFKNLEKQVSIIQQKILTLHKIKEIEDTLDDQKSSMLKNKDDITSLNDEIELLKQQKVINSNELNQKFENQSKNIQADIANNNAKYKQDIEQLNNLLSAKSEENQNQNVQMDLVISQMLSQNLKIQKLDNKLLEMEHLLNAKSEALNQLESNYAFDIPALKNQTLFNAKQIIAVNSTCMNNSKIVPNVANVTNVLNPGSKSLKPRVSYSLAENVLISDMKSQGYRVIYDYLYSHNTTWAELNAVKSTCSSQSILCAGGASVNSDNLLVISCGNCLSILMPTQTNHPVLVNGAYWYFANDLSFGYAPNSIISQGQADTHDIYSNTRISWHIDGNAGGWRLGSKTSLNSDNNYRKIMLLFS